MHFCLEIICLHTFHHLFTQVFWLHLISILCQGTNPNHMLKPRLRFNVLGHQSSRRVPVFVTTMHRLQPGHWLVKGRCESVVKQMPSMMWAESKLRRETLDWWAAKWEDTKQIALSPIQKDNAKPPLLEYKPPRPVSSWLATTLWMLLLTRSVARNRIWQWPMSCRHCISKDGNEACTKSHQSSRQELNSGRGVYEHSSTPIK